MASSSGGDDSTEPVGRRGFIKSIFGLKSAIDVPSLETPATAATKARSGYVFVWTDLRTGQIGFPTGLTMKSGRPGSLMKLVAAAALLEENLVNPNHEFDCVGHIACDQETIHCQSAHGKINLTKAIASSCNCYFVDASSHMQPAQFFHYAALFGLNSSVAQSRPGLFPEKPNHHTYMYVLGLADDLVPTALQILRMAAVIGSHGDVPPMHSAESPESADPRFQLSLKPSTWSVLRSGMEISGRSGTAAKIDPEYKMHIAAKTGTVPNGSKFESWVTGYFPSEKATNAFVIFSPFGTSVDSAVPKAHQLLTQTVWP